MMQNLSVWAAAALLLVACSPGKPEIDEDFEDLAGVDAKSDYFSAKLKLLGTLRDGDAVRARYSKTPRFRGYSFTAAAGDRVDVWVRSTQGDALAWVVDGRFRVVAKNDDASDDTYDAHVVTTLPATTADGRYHVIFRDYDLETHYFDLTFARRVGANTGGDAAWRQTAMSEIARLVGEFSPLDAYKVDRSTIPAAAKARFDASYAVLETPWTYKVPIAGKPVYLVLATDGSGEGATVVADLVDGPGTWFAHGVGHAVWDGGGLGWGNDLGDPTMCRCEDGAGEPATCRFMDGTTATSNEITCD